MSKRIALVGHCGADANYLRIALQRAAHNTTIISVHDDAELNQTIGRGIDLALINRQLDYGFSTEEGVEMIQSLRQAHPNLKMMLVSNYPEAQQAAVAAGALPGFGKREIGSARVHQMLQTALGAVEEKVKT